MSAVAAILHRWVRSRLMADHCFNSIRLLQDMYLPTPRRGDANGRMSAAITIWLTMFMSGSVLSESLFDEHIVPVRYRTFFSVLLSRTKRLLPDPTMRFCLNIHGAACSGRPSDCMRRNVHIWHENVRDLLWLYARLFAIPFGVAIGRQLVHTTTISPLPWSPGRFTHMTMAYLGDVLVATLRLSVGVLCAHVYLTLVDCRRCPTRADYHIASAVATGWLLVGEGPTRRILITRHCRALFVCLLVYKFRWTQHPAWRVLLAGLLLQSLRRRGVLRTVRSLVV